MSVVHSDYPKPFVYHQTACSYPLSSPPPPSAAVAARHHMSPEPPRSASTQYNGCEWSLVIEQQPVRARMCGFGDKDRRPITPPPMVRLVVRDLATGEQLPMESLNPTYYVLSVDLWCADGSSDVNVVRHSATSPSISDASQAAFASTYEHSPVGYGYGQQGMYNPHAPYQSASQQPYPTSSHTRNLIGSLTASAFRLRDLDGVEGAWFILQDLSVRTEGTFRLKMNFVDVANSLGNGVNRRQAPVLATVYSEPFQVYSAKKFPGVIESTPLSKCFADQGIKIPIRREGAKEKAKSASGTGSVKDDDDDDE